MTAHLALSDAQRLEGWKTAARAVLAHPWRWAFGWGPETFPLAYRLHRNVYDVGFLGMHKIADHAHNLPLELLLTLGVVGASAVAWLLWGLWEESDDVGRAALLGAMLVSLVEPVVWYTWGLLFLVLGAHFRKARRAVPREALAVCALGCAVLAAGLWAADFQPAVGWNPASLRVLEARVRGGYDVLPEVELFHPNDADALQLAVIECLSRKQYRLAQLYAHRVVRADPLNPDLGEQTAGVDAYLAAHPALR